MNDYYIFLNSSKNEIYRNNNFFDFTCLLPHEIDVSDGNWELGLSEIHFYTSVKYTKLYILCDLVTSSFISNRSHSVLRFIPKIDKVKTYIFTPAYYFNIRGQTIDRIRIYIKSDNTYNSSLLNESVYCTLHIRHKLPK